MTVASEARQYYEDQFNCAQSVLAPFARRYGMDLETALKIATPFGGGMGHASQVCGAVSGGLMAIGLAKGISTCDRELKYACYDMAKEFQSCFRELHGDITCPGLLGYDIGNPEELEQVREQNLFHTLCPQFVGTAARLADEMIG
ncbi:MAG: C-GCAxxG-C-C family protein [Brevefilum sp.]|nr:C-GCAxxG-C-C family protein [Brevefilum sp.]MDT8382318.1 C-GCAxxG-C-C family protein [Brevefilum sp.]MDW7755008.1 C-GCAxxG-C-C family protein [Brevefilum sp.]